MGVEHLRRLDAHLQTPDVAGKLERLVGAEVLEAVVPIGKTDDALRIELLEQEFPHRALGDLVQLAEVVEDVRQVEDLEFAHAHRPELGHRGGEHLHRAKLQGIHLLAILVQRAVRVHLDLDPALRTLFGQLLEFLRALALGCIERDHVTEFDDDGPLGGRAAGKSKQDRSRERDIQT